MYNLYNILIFFNKMKPIKKLWQVSKSMKIHIYIRKHVELLVLCILYFMAFITALAHYVSRQLCVGIVNSFSDSSTSKKNRRTPYVKHCPVPILTHPLN